jgi:lambda repressor-like predicted transcriptional regulator
VELLRLYSNRHSTPKYLRDIRFVAVEERRNQDESRPRHVPVRLDTDQQAELVVAYNQGACVADLARRYGVHRHTVAAHLMAHDLTRGRAGLARDDIAEACDLYRDGWSLARLGQRFGTTANTVRKRLLLAGVVMRSPNERPSTKGARDRT